MSDASVLRLAREEQVLRLWRLYAQDGLSVHRAAPLIADEVGCTRVVVENILYRPTGTRSLSRAEILKGYERMSQERACAEAARQARWEQHRQHMARDILSHPYLRGRKTEKGR